MNPRLLLLIPTTTYRAEAFVRAAKRLPVELSIASEEPSALTHLHPDALPAFDFSDPDAVARFAVDFHRRYPIDGVVAVDDGATLAAATITERLGLPGNPPDAVYATRNKFRSRRCMTAAGVRTPSYRLVALAERPESVATTIDYPVVVKPLMMAASRGVIRANGPDEFVDAFRRVAALLDEDPPSDAQARNHMLVEQYVPGWEVALEGMVTRGALHTVAVFDKPDPLEGPTFPETIYTAPSRLPEAAQREIRALAADTVRALGLRHGPIHAEFRGGPAGVHLIEIAARSIGGLCSKVVRFEDDLSLEDVILRHAMGFVHAVPEREPSAAGVMMLQASETGRFQEMRGVENARGVPGVDDVIVTAHPGRVVSPLPEGFLYMGFIFARAETPDAVEAALREATARIDMVIEPMTETTRLRAAQ